MEPRTLLTQEELVNRMNVLEAQMVLVLKALRSVETNLNKVAKILDKEEQKESLQ